MALDERKAIAQLQQEEKEQWDVWKDVICLFKEPTRGKQLKNTVSVQAAPESESTSAEIGDLAGDLATVETDNPDRDISKESGKHRRRGCQNKQIRPSFKAKEAFVRALQYGNWQKGRKIIVQGATRLECIQSYILQPIPAPSKFTNYKVGNFNVYCN